MTLHRARPAEASAALSPTAGRSSWSCSDRCLLLIWGVIAAAASGTENALAGGSSGSGYAWVAVVILGGGDHGDVHDVRALAARKTRRGGAAHARGWSRLGRGVGSGGSGGSVGLLWSRALSSLGWGCGREIERADARVRRLCSELGSYACSLVSRAPRAFVEHMESCGRSMRRSGRMGAGTTRATRRSGGEHDGLPAWIRPGEAGMSLPGNSRSTNSDVQTVLL